MTHSICKDQISSSEPCLPVLYGWAVILALLGLTLTGWWWQRLLRLGSGITGPVLCHLAADVSLMLALTGQWGN